MAMFQQLLLRSRVRPDEIVLLRHMPLKVALLTVTVLGRERTVTALSLMIVVASIYTLASFCHSGSPSARKSGATNNAMKLLDAHETARRARGEREHDSICAVGVGPIHVT
jgi:hypothetical protein